MGVFSIPLWRNKEPNCSGASKSANGLRGDNVATGCSPIVVISLMVAETLAPICGGVIAARDPTMMFGPRNSRMDTKFDAAARPARGMVHTRPVTLHAPAFNCANAVGLTRAASADIVVAMANKIAMLIVFFILSPQRVKDWVDS